MTFPRFRNARKKSKEDGYFFNFRKRGLKETNDHASQQTLDQGDFFQTAIYSSYETIEKLPQRITSNDGEGDEGKDKITIIPDDPTVQESFECVFASQIKKGFDYEGLWEANPSISSASMESYLSKDLPSPASFHQSLKTTRSSSLSKPRNVFRSVSLVHIGTYGSKNKEDVTEVPKPALSQVMEGKPSASDLSTPRTLCCCQNGIRTPQLKPKDWPQNPLLFRPTPGSGVRVKGVRFVHSTKYLWQQGDTHTWFQSLQEHWGKACHGNPGGSSCPQCMVLPINNGNEPKGETLVVDFTSPVFEGTIQVRLRHTNGTTALPYDDEKGYFKGLNRRYQVVVQGRPLRELSMQHLATGVQMERPFGKLPPKFLLKGILKVVNFFAPQFTAKFDGNQPSCLSPLGSTPQMIRVNGELDIEPKQEEPTKSEETILGKSSTASTTLARAKFRKKNFDKLYMDQSCQTPTMSPSNVYTFEFLQHLVNFTAFRAEFGSVLGSVPLKDALDGQPLQIMSLDKTTEERLWSFDLWHTDLVDDSKRYDVSSS
mmetsp:Transcript_6088/g.9337  ORF Transcript_6088/g.9337 Transcript_6088/m.9337 type:complete len:542 (+) Transcript_6088:143-1768(+)|eukprot:CAMPEP_0178918458 /NCGR_PEP_ID=MMETSP0786-20121207/13841_1 /TAXON_ID=186022 /ORGANISM="Thalassionema frauenfeldii, Strain CCMP 1798" /LENGTH=541 /DNA_ID=CAMNT_0020592177 /DNA_START=70 /DNA_END=1695 /DNA_ORIENTATION=+